MAAWAVPALAAAAWALRAAVWACLAASAMLVAEAAYMGLASLASAAAMLWRRPDARYRWEPMPGGCDVEAATGADFPMVLVQIPMYNEREVGSVLLLGTSYMCCDLINCWPIFSLLHVAVARLYNRRQYAAL
jgi:hypothetical protein